MKRQLITEFQVYSQLLSATLNVGWCNSDTAAKDWLHEGDYYTKEQHQLDLNEADEYKVVHRDIDVVAHKKCKVLFMFFFFSG